MGDDESDLSHQKHSSGGVRCGCAAVMSVTVGEDSVFASGVSTLEEMAAKGVESHDQSHVSAGIELPLEVSMQLFFLLPMHSILIWKMLLFKLVKKLRN